MSDLAAVYTALRDILAPYAATLEVKRDDAEQLYVDTRHLAENKKPLFFGAVQRKATSVSFHFMPIYLEPDLLEGVSAELKARMQGKSCFRFKAVEPALFSELAALVRSGWARYRHQGLV